VVHASGPATLLAAELGKGGEDAAPLEAGRGGAVLTAVEVPGARATADGALVADEACTAAGASLAAGVAHATVSASTISKVLRMLFSTMPHHGKRFSETSPSAPRRVRADKLLDEGRNGSVCAGKTAP
jgi:hypothetical protein